MGYQPYFEVPADLEALLFMHMLLLLRAFPFVVREYAVTASFKPFVKYCYVLVITVARLRV